MTTTERITTEHATIAPGAAAPATEVSARSVTTTLPNSSLWTTSRLVALVFLVVEVMLAIRVLLKLLGASAQQSLVSAIYAVTGPLVAPFQGIFGQPEGTSSVDIASLLAIVFFMLLGALSLAIVRAVTGSRGAQT